MFDFLFKKKIKTLKTKKIDDIDFKFVKNRFSKNIKIKLKNEGVYVSYPIKCPYIEAEKFTISKLDWIKENLEVFEFYKIDENFKTKFDNFKIIKENIKMPYIRTKGGVVYFHCPDNADFYSKEIQKNAKIALKKALYIKAKEYLPQRVSYLADKFGFKYNKIALKCQNTRWGSCSYKNNINLNINLMNLDSKLIDYVIIHELAHTIEKNHQEGFWRLVSMCMGDYKQIRNELKKERFLI